MLLKEVKSLIKKEVALEIRQKYAFGGLLLYVISTVFICYLSFKRVIEPPVYVALFWIIMLFAAINAIAKSFLSESRGLQLYFYSLASPEAVILSKIIYNLVLMLLLSLINLFFYILFLGNIIQDMPMFLLSLILGSFGFSSVMSMVSAIASKANHNVTLMAILSFPILIPLIMTVIRFSKNAIDGLDFSVNYQYIVMLVGLNVIVIALAYILFPYLWRNE
ncbi:MAG: heme exporter protein CcmB [Bacteroidota bacterium]